MTPRIFVRMLMAALLLAPAVAPAQAFRTYLAANGIDGPACSRAQPCRLLPAALAAVADGGEIWMLDSANYNTDTVNITKSVTILAVPGALGSVVSTGGRAIQIDTPGVEVTLRNLVVVPLPAGFGFRHGVVMSQGAALTVQDCIFANLPDAGIHVENGVAVRVIDSTFRGNAYGLGLKNGVRATVTGSTFSDHRGPGIIVIGDNSPAVTTAEISDTVLEGNAGNGVEVTTVGGSPTRVSIRDSIIVGNGFGGMLARGDGGEAFISASNNLVASSFNHGIDAYLPGSRIFVSGNTVVNNNAPGFRNDQGLVESTGDNAVQFNASPANGPVVPVVMK
jgi:nitrous oxidase accessory protein NosD